MEFKLKLPPELSAPLTIACHYALDLPGMGWSDIVPGAAYEEPQLRAAVVEFPSGLNLQDVTLAGESLGPASPCPHRSI